MKKKIFDKIDKLLPCFKEGDTIYIDIYDYITIASDATLKDESYPMSIKYKNYIIAATEDTEGYSLCSEQRNRVSLESSNGRYERILEDGTILSIKPPSMQVGNFNSQVGIIFDERVHNEETRNKNDQ